MMNQNKIINKQIRKISTSTTLPVLVFILAIYAVSFALRFLSGTAPQGSILRDSGFINLLLYVVTYLICIPLIAFIYQKSKGNRVGIKLSALYKKPQKSAFWCFKWIIISLGFAYIASFVSNMIFTIIELITGTSLNQASFEFGNSAFGWIVTIIAPIIFAPIFEELLFRGVVLKNSEPMGQLFAIIMSGIIFGLWHENYPQFLFATVLGCFSAFMVMKTRSVIPSMIAHFFINSISTGIQLILKAFNISIDDLAKISNADFLRNGNMTLLCIMALIELFVFGLIITAIVFFIIELSKHRKNNALKKSVFNINTSRKIAVFMSSPVTLTTFAIMILSTILNAIPKG